MTPQDHDIDLLDPDAGGVFFVIEEDLDPLGAQGSSQGLFVARTSLKGCTGKDELLRRLKASWRLPAEFGDNWDALADAVNDLDWLEGTGYLLLFDHADDLREASEEDFDILLDILDEAAETWQEDSKPFFAFFAMPESAFNDPDF